MPPTRRWRIDTVEHLLATSPRVFSYDDPGFDFFNVNEDVVASLQPGDRVVYRKQKSSVSPGPRAKAVFASPKGEAYHYVVDKFWTVQQVFEDGSVEVRTRQGKLHRIDASDPRLRPAKWWEKLIYAKRFPSLDDRKQSE